MDNEEMSNEFLDVEKPKKNNSYIIIVSILYLLVIVLIILFVIEIKRQKDTIIDSRENETAKLYIEEISSIELS